MHTYPAWVLDLTDDMLNRLFGPETVARGLQYASQNRVGSINVAGDVMTARVLGNHSHPYFTSVVYQAGRVRGTCTCPMRADCKHVVALIAHARNTTRRRVVPAWQQALAPLLDDVPSGPRGQPLALQFTDRTDGVSLRPVKLGARGKWVKTGANWNDLSYGYGLRELDRAHVTILKSLLDCERAGAYGYGYGYGHSADSLILNGLSPEVWTILERARDAGVQFLPGGDSYRGPTGQPELLDAPVEPVLRLADSAGGLSLAAELVLGERSFTAGDDMLLGRPPHGVVLRDDGRLLLGPLSRPLSDAERRLFATGRPLEVPAAEVPAFASGFLPRLRDRLKVEVGEGVHLPQIEPPRLRCRVEFADASARVAWGFRYGRGDGALTLDDQPHEGEPPVRDRAAEAALRASVPEGPWSVTDRFGQATLAEVTLRGRPLFAFVDDVLPGLRARDDVDVELNAEPPEFREADEAPSVALSVTDSDDGDWFDLGVSVTLGDEPVPLAPLLAALTAGDDHLLLDSGTWFSLDLPELEQLRALIAEASLLGDAPSGGLRLRPEHAGLWEELVRLGVVAEQSAAWASSVGALLSLTDLPEAPVPAGLQAELRPYQKVGYEWLSFLRATRLGGVLADEMGLGKTVQALAMLVAAAEEGSDAPALVVAPTSVVSTWAAEAARFAPGLRVATVTETERRRGVALADAVAGAHLVVTSYTLLRLEASDYRAIAWDVVLLDEAQLVKNHASQAYKAVRRLHARTKIALTGTPLENNLMDLWSILSIAAPGLFPDPAGFTELYRKPIEGGNAETLARLHRRIRPLVLRRTKSSVATELPPKQEQIVPVPLGAGHRRLYDRYLTRERQRVLGLVGDLGRNRITILRSLTLLRQLALSPALVEKDAAAQSAKIDTLVELLGELISEGHRALVFSQFTGFLALVRKRLDAEGIAHEYLDGRTRDRAARIAAFREGTAPAFLISLKAGGFGLTLTEADYVFILDPWWNPAAETQAIDRTHRIGQDKPVNVYRLVSQDTIEEKVVALQRRKRDLFDSVVGSDADLAAPLSADDIRGLLAPD